VTFFADPRAVLGFTLLVIQASLALPLVVRVIRARNGVGISLAGESIWMVAGVGWAVYGGMSGSVALVGSGSIAAITSGLLSALLWPLLPEQRGPALGASAATALGLSAGALIGGWPGLSVALSVFGVMQFIPQLRHSVDAVRLRTTTPGVSVWGSSLRAGYAAGWAVYGGAWWLWGLAIEHIDWPLLIWGAAGAITFGLQGWVAGRSRLVRE
jgi:hypothetical protein